MGKSFTKAENSKKAAGNAKKAEAAAKKQESESSKTTAVEDAAWSKGAKTNSKKEEAASRKAEASRKKAERDAILAAEESAARSTPKNTKTATKKTGVSRGLDLSQLDSDDPSTSSANQKQTALNATGIDNALDALSLANTGSPSDAKVDRHPERRFKAAYAAFEARRLPEIEGESPGLRRNQRVEQCRKEFEKSPENPFNGVQASFDASREEVRAVKEGERVRVEGLLGREE